MSVTCAKKRHMEQCRKHPGNWFVKKCAECVKEQKIEEEAVRAAKEKAKQEKKEAEKDSFFMKLSWRKKDKIKGSDPVNRPSSKMRQ